MKKQFQALSGDFSLLLARIILAAVFIPAGWGKLQNLQRPIAFFETLGIPYPTFMAPTVATFELFCGAALLIGLFTRLASLPIAVIMAVAIFTAKMSEVKALTDLADITEFLYISLALLLMTFGPGRFSLDQFRFKRREHSPIPRNEKVRV